MIDELNENNTNEDTLEIIVYKNNGKLSGISIKNNDTQISIDKTYNENDLEYKINLTDSNYIIFKYSGLNNNQNITENCEIVINLKPNTQYQEQNSSEENTTNNRENVQYKYIYTNNVTFVDQVQIEDLTSQNTVVLNELEEEANKSFMQAVSDRIVLVNKDQMEELGIHPEENPLIEMVAGPLLRAMIYVNASNAINNSQNEMSNLEIETFNNKFEVYAGTQLSGATVKGLLSTIFINNETADKESQIKEINFGGEEYEATDENIRALQDSCDVNLNYKAEFEKDEETGRIYRVVINQK